MNKKNDTNVVIFLSNFKKPSTPVFNNTIIMPARININGKKYAEVIKALNFTAIKTIVRKKKA